MNQKEDNLLHISYTLVILNNILNNSRHRNNSLETKVFLFLFYFEFLIEFIEPFLFYWNSVVYIFIVTTMEMNSFKTFGGYMS